MNANKNLIIQHWQEETALDRFRMIAPLIDDSLDPAKRVRLHRAAIVDKSGRPGELLSEKPLIIACGSKAIELLELQPEGKKKMTAEAFAAGYLRREK